MIGQSYYFGFGFRPFNSWLATTWQGGHVGGQDIKSNFSQSSVPSGGKRFVLVPQHGCHDVTCKPAIKILCNSTESKNSQLKNVSQQNAKILKADHFELTSFRRLLCNKSSVLIIFYGIPIFRSSLLQEKRKFGWEISWKITVFVWVKGNDFLVRVIGKFEKTGFHRIKNESVKVHKTTFLNNKCIYFRFICGFIPARSHFSANTAPRLSINPGVWSLTCELTRAKNHLNVSSVVKVSPSPPRRRATWWLITGKCSARLKQLRN